MDLLASAALGVTALGLGQSFAGWTALERFKRRRVTPPMTRPAVTVLKPLHGDEPLLEQALATFCAQAYPGLQIVFGLQDSADPALHVLRRLRQRFPDLDMDVVVDGTTHGANRKIANLINMFPFAKHDTLVIADSDIHAAPDYLDQLVAALQVPGVGLVTTLYSGRPSGTTLAGMLGAAQINQSFLPGALLARAMGRQDCLGATMALTRPTLTQIGGLEALSPHLADDAVLGRLVVSHGMTVALARTIPSTTVPEAQVPALFEHELRWARTIQSLVPVEFALSIVQYPLFWAALALGLSGGDPWAWVAFSAAWALRGIIAHGIDRALGIASGLAIWWMPLRDLLSVTVLVASYRTDRVAWRGQVLRATPPRLTTPRLTAPALLSQGLAPEGLTSP